MLLEALEIHNTLNPKLWSKDNELLPEVKEKLIDIVNYFVEYIDVPVRVVDVHLVGSNCSYNYTEHSDLDVHIVANFETANVDKTFLMALYNEKRWSFNASHDIKIRGIDVELYVEDIKSTTISNGIYSLYSDKWIKFPEKIPVPKKVDVSHEVERWGEEIQKILNSENTEKIKRAIDLLYMMRKNSIDVDGEYGKGNQIFKEIRNKGLLDELKDAVKKSISKDLSLEQLGEGLLTEDKRSQLLNKSKSSVKGMQRFKRRVKSKVANTVRQFNSIDMNKLFRENILTVNISVNGETDNYIVKISYGGFLDYLKEEVSRNGGIVDLRAITRALLKGFNQDNVYIHCSCPDFYYRFSYVCTKNNTNSGDPQNIPAPITNPHDSLGSSCKHTLLVLNNNSWVIKVASVINNYIAYMEKNYKNMYAEVMYPAIYGKKYEEPVQTSIFDDETELAGENDTDVIDKANIDKVKSTQFQKGNQQGYKFVSDKDNAEQTSIFDDEV